MNLVRRLGTAAVATVALTLAVGPLTAAPAAAIDPVQAAMDFGGGALYNANYAVHVVKDLGGGAYWNVTTNSMYVVDNGGAVVVDVAVAVTGTGSQQLATAVQNGRDTLLYVNGTVLVPLEKALLP